MNKQSLNQSLLVDNLYQRTLNEHQISQQHQSTSTLMRQIFSLRNMIEKNNQVFCFLIEKCNTMNKKFKEIQEGLQMNHLKNGKQFSGQKCSFGIKDIELDLKPSNMDTQKLYIQLFGIKQYKYRLIFEQRFSRTLYKDRNFSFKLALVDNFGKKVKNSYLIPITLSAYNSSRIPEVILENKRGEPIFRGNRQTQLVKGKATFDKIQFRQVTSIYLKHWIYFVIYPKESPFIYKSKEEIGQIDIKYSQIYPLLVNEVLVKSKKIIR